MKKQKGQKGQIFYTCYIISNIYNYLAPFFAPFTPFKADLVHPATDQTKDSQSNF
jgi:hypothetical protein